MPLKRVGLNIQSHPLRQLKLSPYYGERLQYSLRLVTEKLVAPNTVIEPAIKLSLSNLLAGIQRGDADVITTEMEKLDGALSTERNHLHPQLVHFLELRSYVKALMFLGGESDIPVGACGGRAAGKQS